MPSISRSRLLSRGRPCVCRSARPTGRERHRAVQGGSRRATPSGRRGSGGWRAEHAGAQRRGMAGDEHRPARAAGAAAIASEAGPTRAAVLGGGGAARAAACARFAARASTSPCTRVAAGKPTSRPRLGVRAADWPPARGSWDLLVNATPGRAPRRLSTTRHGLTPTSTAVSSTTSYTTRARPGCCGRPQRRGCETLGGLEMLVAQAQRPVPALDGPTARCRRDARGGRARADTRPCREVRRRAGS